MWSSGTPLPETRFSRMIRPGFDAVADAPATRADPGRRSFSIFSMGRGTRSIFTSSNRRSPSTATSRRSCVTTTGFSSISWIVNRLSGLRGLYRSARSRRAVISSTTWSSSTRGRGRPRTRPASGWQIAGCRIIRLIASPSSPKVDRMAIPFPSVNSFAKNSVKIPPAPKFTTGPKNGSWVSDARTSWPNDWSNRIFSATITPLKEASGAFSSTVSRTFRYARSTSSTVFCVKSTPPRSVLWAMSGDTTFTTTSGVKISFRESGSNASRFGM
jgi:hypothetical protein